MSQQPSSGSASFRTLRWIGAVSLPGVLLASALGALVAVGVDAQPASAETSPRQVEVGANHACVLEPDGLVTCWGEDAAGQVSDWGRWRYRSQRFTSISAGSFFTCGILTDGGAMCWGYPEQENGTHREPDHRDWSEWIADPDPGYTGWVNTPPSTVKFRPGSLSVGNFHACAIRTSGELACWGKAGNARLVIPNDDGEVITDWTTVEAGWAHACAIRADGSVVCFGRTTFNRSDGPTGAGPFTDVTLGVYNGCALASDGSVECWGGHPGLAEVNPTINTAPEGITFTAIEMSTTEFYSCGLAQDGTIHCWGVIATAAEAPRVSPPSGSFESISVGSSNSCALDSTGALTCWGDDNSELLEPPSGTFTQISGGDDFNCALATGGTIDCWGGDNSEQQLNTPPGTFILVSSGYSHSCAIRSDGTVACWGGVSGDPPQRHASAVAPLGRFTTLDSGFDLTCGIKTDETLECWGDGSHDRLDEPRGAFSRVAVGASHVCAIRTDGGMVCWGQTLFFDRDGDGNPDDIDGHGNHTTTSPPPGPHRYTDVSAGEGHTCAIREDDRAVCWGYHADSRNIVPGSADSPQGFGTESYSDIATGGANNCAIRSSDGSLACWNAEHPQYWPGSEILAMTGFKSLGAGPSHMCGIDSGDKLVCWGVAGIVARSTEFRTTSPTGPPEVRIVARRVSAQGRIEFAVQERSSEGGWQERVLPARRFMPADAELGRWLVSSTIEAGYGDATVELRVTARRVSGGRVEFGLQVRAADGSWGTRLLPRLRFTPPDSALDRWLNSSPLTAE